MAAIIPYYLPISRGFFKTKYRTYMLVDDYNQLLPIINDVQIKSYRSCVRNLMNDGSGFPGIDY